MTSLWTGAPSGVTPSGSNVADLIKPYVDEVEDLGRLLIGHEGHVIGCIKDQNCPWCVLAARRLGDQEFLHAIPVRTQSQMVDRIFRITGEGRQ